MPSVRTALLYAEAGTGKTLLTNSLIKAIAFVTKTTIAFSIFT